MPDNKQPVRAGLPTAQPKSLDMSWGWPGWPSMAIKSGELPSFIQLIASALTWRYAYSNGMMPCAESITLEGFSALCQTCYLPARAVFHPSLIWQSCRPHIRWGIYISSGQRWGATEEAIRYEPDGIPVDNAPCRQYRKSSSQSWLLQVAIPVRIKADGLRILAQLCLYSDLTNWERWYCCLFWPASDLMLQGRWENPVLQHSVYLKAFSLLLLCGIFSI